MYTPFQRGGVTAAEWLHYIDTLTKKSRCGCTMFVLNWSTKCMMLEESFLLPKHSWGVKYTSIAMFASLGHFIFALTACRNSVTSPLADSRTEICQWLWYSEWKQKASENILKYSCDAYLSSFHLEDKKLNTHKINCILVVYSSYHVPLIAYQMWSIFKIKKLNTCKINSIVTQKTVQVFACFGKIVLVQNADIIQAPDFLVTENTTY